jgi:cytochrome c biogenesis protein CcdA
MRAAAAMSLYSIGYSALIWLASAFSGFATASRHLRVHGVLSSRVSAGVLGALGFGTIAFGITLLRQ